MFVLWCMESWICLRACEGEGIGNQGIDLSIRVVY